MMKREALRLWNINFENNGVHVLKDVSLTLWEGETLGIFGMNDSGISSLMKIILQPQKLTSGRLYRLYADGRSQERAPQILYIKVSNPMINSMTVWENTFVLRRRRHPAFFLSPRRMIQELSCIFREFDISIDPRQYISELSTIEKLQLDIIRAYIANAGIVLMDDFSIDVAPSEFRTLSALIGRMKDMGMSFVFAGHIMENLLQLCDRICFMSNGTILKTADNSLRQDASLQEYINILTGQSLFHYAAESAGCQTLLTDISVPETQNLPSFTVPLYKGRVTAICDTTMKINRRLRRRFESEQFLRRCGYSTACISSSADCQTFPSLTLEDNLCFGKLKQYSTFGVLKKSLVHFVGEEFLSWYPSAHMNLKGNCRGLSHTDSVAVYLFSLLLARPDLIVYDDSMSDFDYSTRHMILQALLKAAHAGYCSVCILNSNLDKLDDFADSYVLITQDSVAPDAAFREVQLAYKTR